MVFLEAIASGLPVVYCDDQLTEGFNARKMHYLLMVSKLILLQKRLTKLLADGKRAARK
jgi:hypothetical protein